MPRPLPGRAGLATLLALAAASLACPPAWADAPAPGCAGTAFTDPAGDSVDGSAFAVDAPGGPNVDVISGFFLDDGTGTVTANIQVADLTTDVPAGATGVDWYMVWTDAAGAQDYVRASVEPGGDPVFSYGTILETPSGGVYQDTDVTSGQFFPGPNGVVQIALPPALATGTLQAPNAQTYEEQNAVVVGRLADADSAPDDGGGVDYAVGTCAAPAAQSTATAAQGSTAPTSSSPPAGQSPSPSSQPSSSPPASPKLGATVRSRSARAATRRHALSVALRTTAPVSGVKGALVDSRGRTVAGGSLARLDGTGTLRLRVKRALRKGAYTLRLKATDEQGRAVARSVRVALTR